MGSADDFVAATSSGCPFVALGWVDAGVATRACADHVAGDLDELVARPPTAVVISDSTGGVIGTDLHWLVDLTTGQVAKTFDQKLALYQRTLSSEMKRLERAGSRVLLVHTIPQFPRWNPVVCGLDVYLAPSSCGTSSLRAELEKQAAPFFRTEQAVLHAVPRATGLDVGDDLCGPTTCSAERGGIWIYRDAGHLSVLGAETLTPAFRRALAGVLSGAEGGPRH